MTETGYIPLATFPAMFVDPWRVRPTPQPTLAKDHLKVPERYNALLLESHGVVLKPNRGTTPCSPVAMCQWTAATEDRKMPGAPSILMILIDKYTESVVIVG